MIPLNFYRDDEYVYYNNPNGITKKMTIADFETAMNGGSSDVPSYDSGDSGKILTVNNDGTGLEWGESQDIDYLYPINVTYNEQASSYTVDKTYAEILSAMDSGKFCIGVGDVVPYFVGRYFDSDVTYIQFYDFYCATVHGTDNMDITMEGFQLAPDGTITSFSRTVV